MAVVFGLVPAAVLAPAAAAANPVHLLSTITDQNNPGVNPGGPAVITVFFDGDPRTDDTLSNGDAIDVSVGGSPVHVQVCAGDVGNTVCGSPYIDTNVVYPNGNLVWVLTGDLTFGPTQGRVTVFVNDTSQTTNGHARLTIHSAVQFIAVAGQVGIDACVDGEDLQSNNNADSPPKIRFGASAQQEFPEDPNNEGTVELELNIP